MAEVAIRLELAQLRAAIDAMRADRETFIDRDNRVTNRVGEIERNHADRLNMLEAAYVARDRDRDRDNGVRTPTLKTREAEKFMPET
eukprot:11778425-Heterocapsa_arctica.AAC.2